MDKNTFTVLTGLLFYNNSTRIQARINQNNFSVPYDSIWNDNKAILVDKITCNRDYNQK